MIHKLLGTVAALAFLTSGSLLARPISFGPKASFGLGNNIGDLNSRESKTLSGTNFSIGAEALIGSAANTFWTSIGVEYSKRTVKLEADSVLGSIENRISTPQIEVPVYVGGLLAHQVVVMGGLIPRIGVGQITRKDELNDFSTKEKQDYDEANIKKFALGAGLRLGAIIPIGAGKLMPTLNFTSDIFDRIDENATDDKFRNFSIDASLTYFF